MVPKDDLEAAASKETARIYGEPNNEDIDLWLLRSNLKMTPWERMQANDDALNFGEMLRAGVERNEKFKASAAMIT